MDLTTLPRSKLFSSIVDSTLSFVDHFDHAEFSDFKITVYLDIGRTIC